MAMTRKEVKEFIEDPESWEIIPGNDYVRIALLKHPGVHVAQIQHRHDENAWKFITKREDYEPRIVWDTGNYFFCDTEAKTLLYGTSKTELENKIYAWEKL